ncbi:hypothetical protein ACC694_38590, partial [Rhizobium ruizarguesonis]
LFAKHLLKPSSLPVVTVIALTIGELLGGQAHLRKAATARDGRVLLPGIMVEVGDEDFGDLSGDGDAERDRREKCRP